jgi:serine/threonine protein kinase
VDERLGRHVAVKLVTTTDATAAARLRAEATVLARLRHPNIVNVFDVGDHEGRPFVVTELVRGRSLGDRLASPGPTDPAWLADVGAQMASALACAHAHDIVHRDLKPSNILLAEPGGQARLIDFGIAVSDSAMALTSTGMVIGTPAYLSPEQVEGRRAGAASDVYALGLVLIEALTGSRAFPGTPTESMAARLQRDAPLPEEVPADWSAVLGPMTRLAPSERPTADDAARMLGALRPADVGPDATTAAMGAITSVFPAVEPHLPPRVAGGPTPEPPVVRAATSVPLVEPIPSPPGRGHAGSRRRTTMALVAASVVLVAVLGVLGAMAVGGDRGSDPPPATAVVETGTPSAPTSAPTSTPTTAPATTTTTTRATTTVPPPTTTEAPAAERPGPGREGRGRPRGPAGDDD